jgi:hypothetical protein
MKGRYANMWRKQIRAERAFEAASKMVEKANALQKAVMERPGSSGNEEGASGEVSENEADNRSSTTLAPSLSAKAPSRIAERLRTDSSTMEEDDKTADFDGNPDTTRSPTSDGKTEVGEGEPVSAEADNSKTHDHS